MRLAVLLAVWTAALGPVPLLQAQTVAEAGSTDCAADPTDAGPNHRLVQWVENESDSDGQLFTTVHTYVELGLGLNRWDDASEQWVPSQPEFEQTRDGFLVARQTQHRAILDPDLAVEGAVDVLTPDGVRLRSSPLGIALVDASSGSSVMLGEVASCKVEWVGPGEAIYRRAFRGLEADVRYRLTLDGIEQDIMLEEQIPPELVAELGLNPAATRVLILTEFFDAPEPVVTPMAEGMNRFGFGDMEIGPGQAFRVEPETVEGTAVVRPSWELIEGRRLLVESVEYAALGPLMDALPVPDQGRIESLKSRVRRTASVRPGHLSPRQARTDSHSERELRSAGRGRWGAGLEWAGLRRWAAGLTANAGPARSVVLDYALQLSTGQSNYVFKGDTTYYVTAALPLKGVSTFEGGTVIKFAPTNGAKLKVEGPILWQGSAYRPVVLTARDDASVGDSVSGAGTLTNYYAAVALEIDRSTNTTAAVLGNFRIAHAQTAIAISGQPGHVLRHGQLVNCRRGLSATNAESSLRNVLFHNVLTNLAGSGSTGRLEQVTVNTAARFNDTSAFTCLYLTNSLLAGVTNLGWPGTFVTNAVVVGSADGVFQSVGQGANYLAAGSPYRNWAGASINIEAGLLGDLVRLTTYPPVELTADFTMDTVLGPQAQRDWDGLDLGYHYDPLDYVWSGLNLTNATLVLTNGVAVAVYGSKGVRLRNGARFVSQGMPGVLNRLARYPAVQEQPVLWGSTPSSFLYTESGSTVWPEEVLRFTEIPLLAAGRGRVLWDSALEGQAQRLALTDCHLAGVTMSLEVGGSDPDVMTVALTNNLIERASLSLVQAADSLQLVVLLRNNLFWRGSLTIRDYDDTETWEVRENAFDGTSLSSRDVSVSHNGYINAPVQGGVSNVVLSAFVYTNGPLGAFYHLSTNLVNAGSRSAAAAGLYHHTTQADGTKEGTSTVDIGFHYPAAVMTNGVVVLEDADGDGLPDCLEDTDGDGNAETGETNWQESENGTTGGPGLQVFTPLQP